MTIMITNDDGLTDGIRVLSEAASLLDKDSYTITPDQQKSAVAKGVTLHKILRLMRMEEEALPIYELNGTPADCVAFALHSGEFKRPDLALSGINIGENLSLHAFYSSGTIGACLEAAFFGIPAIAFSLEKHGEERAKSNYGAWPKRDALREKIIQLVKKFRGKIPKYTILNVNLPESFEDAGMAFPKPALMRYVSKMEKRLDPHSVPYYWQYGNNVECEEGSDVSEFSINKCITVTPLSIFGIVDDELVRRLKE